ncbi:unnamed protein product [Tilletia controversa]|nr:hypothetical protein CF328_g1784 [Tilletia controversa]CAD6898842.1 unnamed protein product [Tilletia controversa]CAD6921318.1 unnamed protein product [Tilletia controversa]CAD6966872.1 unnamed protein product [Tilletia controversa]
MSVLLETSVGDIVLDLETDLCPRATTNFLKLCKSYYYNYTTFFSVQSRFLAQSGDPTNSGQGGESVWSHIASSSSATGADRFFSPEMPASLKHRTRGTLSLALVERPHPTQTGQTQLVAGSQFFITLADNIDYLDGKHAVIGHVVEGAEPGAALDKLDAAFTDDQNRPLTDIRIRGVVVLDDPFPDPPGMRVPSRTPSPTPEQLASVRLSEAEAAQTEDTDLAPEEREAKERAKNSKAAALTLEMVGDLPFAEIRPPENILFICKLNPVTRSEDLELIFSRFGQILTCEVIKDKKSGDSLQYAFIEFAEREYAEMAYFKMQNTLIDDRRIWVDFSQSVSKLHGDWLSGQRKGGRKAAAEGSAPGRSGPTSGADRRDRDYDRGGDRSGHRQRDRYERPEASGRDDGRRRTDGGNRRREDGYRRDDDRDRDRNRLGERRREASPPPRRR